MYTYIYIYIHINTYIRYAGLRALLYPLSLRARRPRPLLLADIFYITLSCMITLYNNQHIVLC